MLADELAAFYTKNGFGNVPGKRPATVLVYTGCMLVPLPNLEVRRRFLKYHDFHHLLTGYSVGRVGEGEVSAWELGTGSLFVVPMLGLMNLIALSTGLFLEPKRMWVAFARGCRSQNLYSSSMRRAIDNDRWRDVDSLRRDIAETRPASIPQAFRIYEFAFYACAALIIHGLLVVPAMIMRVVTDFMFDYNFFHAIKPKKRTDLY